MNDTDTPLDEKTWHARSAAHVLEAVKSQREGLSPEEAQARLHEVGPNVLPRRGGPTVLQLLWRQVNNPLIFVLLGSGVLALLMGKGVDGAVVLGVVILNMIIGFIQEYRAGKAIEALSSLVPENANVLRGGRPVTLPAAALVPGDVVLVQSGDKVPADVRLIAGRNLHVEEAALTGESVPVSKSPEPVAEASSLGDRHSMLYSGTLVTSGTGSAVVVATAGRTQLGRISALLDEAQEIETPLTRQLEKFSKVLTVGIAVVAVMIFAVALLRGFDLVDAVLAGITLAVAAIPEGLPAIITIALAIGVQRMAGRRAVIRKLPAVETLGATTVICSDKTGTLTRGEMTVQALWTPGSGRYEITGTGYAPEGMLRYDDREVREVPGEVEVLLTAAALCNDSTLNQEGKFWKITGDPTEAALVVAAEKLELHVPELRQTRPRLDVIPFESERQYMATLHEARDKETIIYLKGAPEVVVPRCGLQAKDERYLDFVLEHVESLAREGMRVLAVAAKKLPDGRRDLDERDAEGGFNFLGLVAMMDPPRAEAVEAVAACKRAGIEVKMITGDHRATAQSIGRQLGLVGEESRVYTGDELEGMSDEELGAAAQSTRVFARVAPEHKLRLVRSLQAQRHVVAMTGDGVNDAPALKQADIGVAMGIAGTDASKQAADMVLADDNFASIESAVEEGRRVYDNLVKSLAFVLPTNIGEALIILIAVAFFPAMGAAGILMPMLPVQILWINLVATVALALPLAFEAMEPGLMDRPPRHPDEPVMNRFVMFRTVVVALLMTAGALVLFLWEYNLEIDRGTTPELALRLAQTAAVTTVILFQIVYLVQCRSLRDSVLEIGLFTNPYIYGGIALLLALQLAYVYAPFMHELFSSAPLDTGAWVRATLAALIVLPVIAAEKKLRARRERTRRKGNGGTGAPALNGRSDGSGVELRTPVASGVTH